MKRLLIIASIVSLTALTAGSMSCWGSGSSGGNDYIPVIPLIVDKTMVLGIAPGEAPTGPDVVGLDSVPGLDVVEQGGQFTLVFTSNMAGGDTITGAILLLEDDFKYYQLQPVVAGNVATSTFTINPDYPEGDYVILLALLGPDGEAGTYVRIILHVAFVPTLEIIELYPLTTAATPEGRREEALNVTARAVFSKQVISTDFTLRIEDVSGDTISGNLTVLPDKYSASFEPLELLDPNRQYVVVAQVTDGPSWSNIFWTETTVALGDTANQAAGRAYSMVIGAENIVEPAAAKLVWNLLGSAIPPFLIMFNDVDSAGGVFTAIGGLAEGEYIPLIQDTDVPVAKIANDSEFNDPYFLAEPTDISLATSVSGVNLSLILHQLALSGKLEPDLNSFTNGKASLFIDVEGLRDLINDFITLPPDISVCDALMDTVGQNICNDAGQLVIQADGLVGVYEPTLTEMFDLVPTSPPDTLTLTAGAPASITVEGMIELNAQAYLNSGWTAQVSATHDGTGVGTFTPVSPVTVNADGSFTTQLDIGAGVLDAAHLLEIHFTCPEMPSDDSWERVIELEVVP